MSTTIVSSPSGVGTYDDQRFLAISGTASAPRRGVDSWHKASARQGAQQPLEPMHDVFAVAEQYELHELGVHLDRDRCSVSMNSSRSRYCGTSTSWPARTCSTTSESEFPTTSRCTLDPSVHVDARCYCVDR